MLQFVEPRLSISVTDTGITALGSPWTVNGCVNRNWLPNWLLEGFCNQVPKRLVTSIAIEEADEDRVWPVAAWNAKTARVTSLAVEKPVTATVIPFVLRVTFAPSI